MLKYRACRNGRFLSEDGNGNMVVIRSSSVTLYNQINSRKFFKKNLIYQANDNGEFCYKYTLYSV